MNNKLHIKSVFNTLMSSYIIYWMYIGLSQTPYFSEQIEIIKYFPSSVENWTFSDYILTLILNVIMLLGVLTCYIVVFVPILTLTFFPNLYEEFKDKPFELYKIHLYQVLIILGLYFLFSYEYTV